MRRCPGLAALAASALLAAAFSLPVTAQGRSRHRRLHPLAPKRPGETPSCMQVTMCSERYMRRRRPRPISRREPRHAGCRSASRTRYEAPELVRFVKLL
jgi:hypothetical protein